MFSWDEVKNASNHRKHGVSFEAAALVFDDPRHLSRLDRVENGEQRWQTIGKAGDTVIILVAHTWIDAEAGEQIRIIAARRATKLERKIYEQSV